MNDSPVASPDRHEYECDHEHEHEIAHPVFATLYDLLPESTLMGPHREYLTAGLSGRILEIGCGNGELFSFVAAGGDDLEYHAIEPDPHMRRRAVRNAREEAVAVDLRDARAESLPYPDDAFDVVISSLVFCTVQEVETALSEVARVLKPGGEFRFLEHVRADGWRGAGQDALTPLWERVAAGCQLNRNTIDRFVGHEAFEAVDVERLEFSLFPVTPIVRGRLQRRRTERVGLSAFGAPFDP
ncbi:class I SAM-dependent methyltransferase [Natrarchaeobaculum sulfurireducens]|uniref:Methyltransferase type 11 n=1 Tax=Natrarchaeobaculum sulfurireducens TaxID=2044521 RepID=A0A346PT99_9EURY|nr:class I SAM-dependent methyltransferase [Natrarchaeobaculum sulfurireducens]AXR77293.1 SAM-dependent methyltransferase [Natrarchaeobaculum sulfurireducens]AXR82744.1 Methyltransferase type 11 [Natrarchaeobaculum sulfurireducens]